MENLRSARRMELKAKAALCGGSYQEIGPAFIGGSQWIPDAHFNRISIIGRDKFDGHFLAECLGRIGEGMPVFIDLPHPVSESARKLLEEYGFHFTGESRSSMMAGSVEVVGRGVEGLDIEVVCPDTLDIFLELFLRGFNTPEEIIPFAQATFHELVLEHCRPENVRLYLGIFRGEPACTLYLFFEGDEGGVNMVATKDSLRGKGLATAMLRRAMEDSFQFGVRRLSLETRWDSAPERLYRRMGFATIGRHEVFSNMHDLAYGL